MKRLKSDDTLDRLSELPNSLIFLILSLLPMRDVVKTSILSKRWKDLWLTLPCLNFAEFNTGYVNSRNFINRALLLWKGTEIQKLEIRFRKSFPSLLFRDMDLWLCFAKERKVEELYIQIPYENRTPVVSFPVYNPPQCLYSCSSIKKLSLIACNLQIRGDVHWDQLKVLKIHGYGFTEELINQLVSSSPRLESFTVRLFGTHHNLSIRSTSLKRLSVFTSKYESEKHTVLTIWAPNLEALEISGVPFSKCLLMDALSLRDVSLDILDKWAAILGKKTMATAPSFHHVLGETLMEVLPTFPRVEAVTLSACCFKMFGVMRGEYLFSPLTDVKLLRFSSGPIKPNDIVVLLEVFPNVEILVIDWNVDAKHTVFLEKILQKQYVGEIDGENYLESEEASILMRQLKRVEINWYLYEASIFQFIEFMLEHATKIEKIVIQKKGKEVVELEDMFLAAQKVVNLQRSFPTVELILRKT